MNERKMNELDVFRHELMWDGTSAEEFAMSIGMTYASYKNVIRDGSKVVPKWVLAFLFGRGYVYEGDVLVQKKSDASHQINTPNKTNGYFNCNTTSEYVKSVSYAKSEPSIIELQSYSKELHDRLNQI
jgi:hypothetical protein